MCVHVHIMLVHSIANGKEYGKGSVDYVFQGKGFEIEPLGNG